MERLDVHIRPARETDTPDVIDLTRMIWDGEDYVPSVWADWLADEPGMLSVAEYEGRVLGLGKLTRLSDEDWWLEGLRVHPQYEGRGIASRLHKYLTEYWLQTGHGTLRLATASFRLPVHHLCERFGFQKILESTSYLAPALNQNSAIEATEVSTLYQTEDQTSEVFTIVTQDGVDQAVSFAVQSQTLSLNAGMVELGWRFAPPRAIYLAEIAKRKKLLWWRRPKGLLALREDEEDNQGNPSLIVQFLACSLEAVAECLVDYRRLAGALGYAKAFWMAPLQPELLLLLEKAGFQRDWDASLWLYEKKYPRSPSTSITFDSVV